MKSKNIKNVIEVLPMKRGETLANVKTKINTSYVPKQFTANMDADVLLVMVNCKSGEYLGNMKIVYSEQDVPLFGSTVKKRVANVVLSEFAESLDDALYVKALDKCMHGQAWFNKFAHYIHINRECLSERMDSLVGKSSFKPMRQNPQIYELNIEAIVILCIMILLILL